MPVSNDDWTLDDESELQVLIPWLAAEPGSEIKNRVMVWIVELVQNPVGRGVEERPGVFTATVPDAERVVIWTLDLEKKLVVLLHIGPA